MTNEKLLRAKIESFGFKIGFVCEKLSMSRQCFLNKLSNKTEFVASEIYKLKEILQLTWEEVELIFFNAM